MRRSGRAVMAAVAADTLHAVRVRTELQVHQHQVDPTGGSPVHGVDACRGLGDDLDVRGSFEHGAQAGPDDRWSSASSTRMGIRHAVRGARSPPTAVPAPGSGLDRETSARWSLGPATA